MNSNKSSKIKPLWEGSCDVDDVMCEFADKDDYPAVGSVRILLQLLDFITSV
jgi:mitogen-activated protein kinase kinase kinase ANP1